MCSPTEEGSPARLAAVLGARSALRGSQGSPTQALGLIEPAQRGGVLAHEFGGSESVLTDACAVGRYGSCLDFVALDPPAAGVACVLSRFAAAGQLVNLCVRLGMNESLIMLGLPREVGSAFEHLTGPEHAMRSGSNRAAWPRRALGRRDRPAG